MAEIEIIALETDSEEINAEDAALILRMKQNPIVQELVAYALRSVIEDIASAPRGKYTKIVKREWKLYVCEFWCCFHHGGVFLEDGRYFSCFQKLIKFVDARRPQLVPTQMNCFVKAFESELSGKISGFIDALEVPDTQQKFACRDCEAMDLMDEKLEHRCRRYTYTAQNANYVELIPW